MGLRRCCVGGKLARKLSYSSYKELLLQSKGYELLFLKGGYELLLKKGGYELLIYHRPVGIVMQWVYGVLLPGLAWLVTVVLLIDLFFFSKKIVSSLNCVCVENRPIKNGIATP